MLFCESLFSTKNGLSSSVSLNVEKLSQQYTREAFEGRGRRVIYVFYGTASCLEQVSKFGKIRPGQPKSEQEVGVMSTELWKKTRRNCSTSN
jgi:hypothetical protein